MYRKEVRSARTVRRQLAGCCSIVSTSLLLRGPVVPVQVARNIPSLFGYTTDRCTPRGGSCVDAVSA